MEKAGKMECLFEKNRAFEEVIENKEEETAKSHCDWNES